MGVRVPGSWQRFSGGVVIWGTSITDFRSALEENAERVYPCGNITNRAEWELAWGSGQGGCRGVRLADGHGPWLWRRIRAAPGSGPS